MKIIPALLLCVTLCMPAASNARGDGFTAFYEKYKDNDNFEALSLKPGLLRMFMDKDDKDLKELMKHIKQFKMLVCDTNPEGIKHFSNELNEIFVEDHYEDLLVVNDGGDNVTFKVHKKDNRIIEVVMLATDKESLSVLYIKGDISVDEVKQLSKSVSIKKS